MQTDLKRISRLTAIVTQLQARRLTTAAQLAARFGVSVRTVYRDIRTLEQSGVPIITEEGKGYTLMDGYRLPPVMFTDSEAHALVTAEQLMSKSTDTSLREAYALAIGKVKAVLQCQAKEKAELLASRIAVSPAIGQAGVSHSLTYIQDALTHYKVLQISYQSAPSQQATERQVEPFALYYSLQESWLLIAFCRLRKDFRMFRLDRILGIQQLGVSFAPHQLTLAEYLNEKQKNFTTPDIPLS